MLLGAGGDLEYRVPKSGARPSLEHRFGRDAVLQENVLRQHHDAFTSVVRHGTDQGSQTVRLAEVTGRVIGVYVRRAVRLQQ